MDRRNRPDSDYHALLAAYRDGERMPPRLREAVWQRLRTGEAERPPPARDHRRDWAWGLVMLAAAVLLVVAVHRRQLAIKDGAGDAASTQAAHDSHAATARALRAAEPPATKAAPTATDALIMVKEPETAPPLLRPRPKNRLPQSPPSVRPVNASRIDAELALLAAARAALNVGTPADALPHLAEHARQFPAGNLTEERMRLEVEARCALGQRSEARALATALQILFNGSPHLPAVTAPCVD